MTGHDKLTLAGALWLAERHFPVFPVDHPGLPQCIGLHFGGECDGNRGKHPGAKFATVHSDEPEQVRDWFAGPARNIGVMVGAARGPARERLLVTDDDAPGALETVADGRTIPTTMATRTAKGLHRYWWLPTGVTHSTSLGALKGRYDGDIRAGNAYVIGAGSLHQSGARYELVDPEQPPVPIPDWLLDELKADAAPPRVGVGAHPGDLTHRFWQPRARTGRVQITSANRRAVVEGLLRSVTSARPPAEGGTGRHAALFWAACAAAEHVRDYPHLFREAPLRRALEQAGVQVGIAPGEAERTVRNAFSRIHTGGAA